MAAPILRPKIVEERILGNLITSVMVFDDGLQLSYMNPAAEELFAVSCRQVIGSRLEELVLEGNGLLGRVQEAMQSNQPMTVHELAIKTSSGIEHTVDCSVTPVSASGQGTEVLVELLPLGRHVRINREDNLMAQQDAAHELLRGLAHEIKNPLGGLRGAAQLLERELEETELKEYTGIIIGEADRLQGLIDRLLGPSRPPNKQTTNMHRVLEHVCKILSAEGMDGVAIVRDYDPSVPKVLADADMMIQVVLNIMRNAVQAMNGAGELTLRTRIERQFTVGNIRHKLVLQLDIIDNGPGIKPELIDTIFYPMVTGSADGTGLGLSIAQTLVHQHSGLIECTSNPGETIFSIILPLELVDE